MNTTIKRAIVTLALAFAAQSEAEEGVRVMGVGMPASIMLRAFGECVRHAFGHVAYHVGSSLNAKDNWRDVDVRVLLPDDEYERLGFGDPERPQENARWSATVLAWSTFGRSLTGLPIDFQIQQRSHANATYNGRRSALINIWPDVERTRVRD